MKYTSTDGYLFYYDKTLYTWQLCEPSMLFLLGLESITMYNNSLSDQVILTKYIYQSVTNTLIKFKDFQIYDDIYNFLTQYSNVDDTETHMTYNCHGVKLTLNDLTGTTSNRTVPLIFKNENNAKLISLQNDLNLDILDVQASKIIDIFTDVHYSDELEKHIVLQTNSDGDKFITYKGNNYIISDPTKIDYYNQDQHTIWSSRDLNNQIFKYLDYKAMYSYALGVLYGCRCLGYNKEVIWRYDPQYWYDGDYKNLVSTAWHVVNFCYSDSKFLDDSKLKSQYHTAPLNKLWNISTSESLSVPLSLGETLLLQATKNPSNRTTVSSLIYKRPLLEEASSTNRGQYIVANSTEWNPIDDKISLSPLSGLISPLDYTTWYIGDYPIIVYSAYSYNYIEDNTIVKSYLSPSQAINHYIGIGDIGWIQFDEDSWPMFYSENRLERPSDLFIAPYGFDDLKLDSNSIGWAYNKSAHNIVSYYKSDIQSTSDHQLYCIFSGTVNIALNNSLNNNLNYYTYNSKNLFDVVLSKSQFEEYYTELSSPEYPKEQYVKTTYYNLSNPLVLYVDGEFYWAGNDNRKIEETGCSLTPSLPLNAYYIKDNTLQPFNLRYNESYNKYWSTAWLSWKSQSEYLELNSPVLILSKTSVPLYMGSRQLISDAYLYYAYNNEPALDVSINKYRLPDHPEIPEENLPDKVDTIFNDNKSYYSVYENISNVIDGSSFTTLSDLYNLGITTYMCEPITEDDYGNSLLDNSGKVVVWYDSIYHKYWNGFNHTNQWQDNKPSAST